MPMSDSEFLRSWLDRQPPSRIADWLDQARVVFPPLAIALEAERDRLPTGAPNPAALREAIRRLMERPEHATWRDAADIGNVASLVCTLLGHSIDDGADAGVVELAEFAMQRAEQLAMDVQDSEIWSGSLFGELAALHLRACRHCNPDPIEVVRRSHRLQRQSELGIFDRFPLGYEEFLGETGMAEWRRLAGSREKPFGSAG